MTTYQRYMTQAGQAVRLIGSEPTRRQPGVTLHYVNTAGREGAIYLQPEHAQGILDYLDEESDDHVIRAPFKSLIEPAVPSDPNRTFDVIELGLSERTGDLHLTLRIGEYGAPGLLRFSTDDTADLQELIREALELSGAGDGELP